MHPEENDYADEFDPNEDLGAENRVAEGDIEPGEAEPDIGPLADGDDRIATLQRPPQ